MHAMRYTTIWEIMQRGIPVYGKLCYYIMRYSEVSVAIKIPVCDNHCQQRVWSASVEVASVSCQYADQFVSASAHVTTCVCSGTILRSVHAVGQHSRAVDICGTSGS